MKTNVSVLSGQDHNFSAALQTAAERGVSASISMCHYK
jgi:hypothetical protein